MDVPTTDLDPRTDRSAAPPKGGPRRRGKGDRPQVVLEVISRSRITPNLMRVVLGGEQITRLADNDCTDKYVKLLLPDPASGLTPPYDLDALRAETPELLPAIRTYTVRHWDREKGRIHLDVVLHGDGALDGVAAQWADAALPGDWVAMRGAGGGYAPDPGAGHHLLIGDHSALPAIAAALEALPDSARGLTLLQLDHDEDRLQLTHPDGVEVRWLIGERELLLEETLALELPDIASVQVFAHGERDIIKRLRRHLVRERGIAKEQISISAYWALGRIEDQFQAEKREPIGRIDADDD
ncbi:MAG: siderophore-interacting protein [Brachybacterium sp.]|nr:siderophore-interacting protein [Brachybacterium sp.]